MKWIKYNLISMVNVGTEEEPLWESKMGAEKEIHCSRDSLEVNEEIAKAEAYNGQYIIEDDGQPEPVVEPTNKERIEALEAAMLEMMGVAVDG